jgi:DNA-binding NtrC family response regulator
MAAPLFLDEIGEIDASTQVKLLRFLETRSFERLGSSKSIKVDIRLVCATNRNLSEMVQKGEFREDLYYRLNVIRIHLPSLIERKEDIPLLLKHYIDIFSQENGFAPLELSKEALNVLVDYPWPGNIRELRNFCENIIILKQGQTLIPEDLEAKFFPYSNRSAGSACIIKWQWIIQC